VYQAVNAVQIAQAAGASQYAPEVMAKAQQLLGNAQSLQAQKADKSLVIMAAREAAQTAEDARALAAQRAKDAELAQVQAVAAHEQQLRLQAETQARQAQAQAEAAHAQAQAAQAQAQADRMQLEAVQQAQTAPPPAALPAVTPETIPPPATLRDDRQQRDLRVSLLQQINGSFPARDTPQGLVATISDFDFHGAAFDAPLNRRLESIASLAAAHPGLMIEVDGFSDSASPDAERIAATRAAMVRDALVRAGLPNNAVTVRSLGNSRPLGSNATAQGRAQNRRVEIVISGEPIGNLASWDKGYTVVPR
jgi:outer membrane protein OmpA-like peptidoglycan-associated protein